MGPNMLLVFDSILLLRLVLVVDSVKTIQFGFKQRSLCSQIGVVVEERLDFSFKEFSTFDHSLFFFLFMIGSFQNRNSLLYFVELGREERRQRREVRERKASQEDICSKGTIEEKFSKEIKVETMAQLEHKRTLRDLVDSDLTQQPLYISYPKTIGNFEFKTASPFT